MAAAAFRCGLPGSSLRGGEFAFQSPRRCLGLSASRGGDACRLSECSPGEAVNVSSPLQF